MPHQAALLLPPGEISGLGSPRNRYPYVSGNPMTASCERFFGLAQRGTDVRTELTAGATTFLTMAYIAFVNPQILSDAGMPFDAVFVATCLAAAFSTLVMGLYANYPIALAPGMGINAFLRLRRRPGPRP